MIRELKYEDIDSVKDFPPIDWNFDYKSFLIDHLGQNYFFAIVFEHNNAIIGTGNCFYLGKVGWLANIIVLDQYRGNGFGTKITKSLSDYLVSKGCAIQSLIATKLGKNVYKRMGFREVCSYSYFKNIDVQEMPLDLRLKRTHDIFFDKVCLLDKETNNEDRSTLLKRYYNDGWVVCDTRDKLEGFYLPNFGHGLIIASTNEAGELLLQVKHSAKNQRTAVPEQNLHGLEFFNNSSFVKTGECTKMVLGNDFSWKPQNVYSYGSGCFG